MSMDNALIAMRDIVASETPALASYVYAFSGEERPNLDAFPTAIISHAVLGKTDEWRMKASGLYRHHWTIAVDIFLGKESLPDWEVEELARPWYEVLGRAIMGNPTLNGTAEPPTAQPLITFETGYIAWYDFRTRKTDSYWGIHAEYAISQQHIQQVTP